MPNYLSFSSERKKDAIPIAIVRGGEADGNILYIHNDNKQGNLPKSVEISSAKYPLSHLKPKQRDVMLGRMNRSLYNDEEDIEADPRSKEIYKRIKNDRKQATQVVLPEDSFFQIVPNTDPTKRDIFYLAGSSGSGKSYLSKSIAENYKKLYPEREVYLISKLTEDPVLDNSKAKPKRISIQSLVEEPVEDIEEFKDSLIIADDVDTFTGKEEKVVQQLIDDISAMGRHHRISLIVATHRITNYKKTRLLLNEASHYVLYPQSTSFHNLKYLLSNYMGLASNEIKGLRQYGRWICYYKNAPNYFLSEHTAKLLHTAGDEE